MGALFAAGKAYKVLTSEKAKAGDKDAIQSLLEKGYIGKVGKKKAEEFKTSDPKYFSWLEQFKLISTGAAFGKSTEPKVYHQPEEFNGHGAEINERRIAINKAMSTFGDTPAVKQYCEITKKEFGFYFKNPDKTKKPKKETAPAATPA